MHARVSILEGSPDKIDEGLSYFREEVQPAWETDPGFKGAIVLNDRQSGKTLAVTFWESEENMRAMEEDANRVRSKVAETAGQEIVGVERYEVSLFEVEG
jgi:heme-degrading monooxygenase HmoA